MNKVPLARVSDLAEQVRGVSYKKEEASTSPKPGYLPLLRAGNITDEGLVFDDLVFVPAERISKKQKVCRYDVVIAASSGSLDIVGKAAPMLTDFDCGFGAFCKVLRPNSKVHPGYFAHFFKTKDYRQRISALAAGANINNLRNEHLDEMEIPLPPLPEQKRIADILDRAEALRAKRRTALAQLDELIRSIFIEMFGDPIKNAKKWETLKFSEVGTLQRGISKHRPRNAPELLGGKYPLIQTGDVANSRGYITEYTQTYSELGLKQSKMWSAGTLCITIAANIAKTGILTFDACFPDSIVGFIPNEKVKIEYVKYWMSFLQKMLEESAPESAQKNINLKILFDLSIPVPPLELQNKFTSTVYLVEKIKQSHQQSLLELNNLFDSLTHEAFTGNLFSHQIFEQKIESGVKI